METEDQGAAKGLVDIHAHGQEPDDLITAIDKFQSEVIGGGCSIDSPLRELITTVYQSFQYQEYLMETSKYPLNDIHTMEHNRIMSSMVHAMTRFEEGDLTMGQIIERLRVMFRVHAENFDVVLFDYFRKKYSS
jgi:hemerythrin